MRTPAYRPLDSRPRVSTDGEYAGARFHSPRVLRVHPAGLGSSGGEEKGSEEQSGAQEGRSDDEGSEIREVVAGWSDGGRGAVGELGARGAGSDDPAGNGDPEMGGADAAARRAAGRHDRGAPRVRPGHAGHAGPAHAAHVRGEGEHPAHRYARAGREARDLGLGVPRGPVPGLHGRFTARAGQLDPRPSNRRAARGSDRGQVREQSRRHRDDERARLQDEHRPDAALGGSALFEPSARSRVHDEGGDGRVGRRRHVPAAQRPVRLQLLGSIPAVPHLHGGEIPAQIDGSPDSWFTSAATPGFGPKYYTKGGGQSAGQAVYTYPNLQEPAPLWFHDHTLGATRLNVYAGLAGGYYLVDPAQDIPESLKDVTQVVPLILQDRMFDTNGELFFTSDSKGGLLWALNPEHPYWNPEFVGDTLVVNGKVWPYLQVEQKRYRFLFLNGSNARTYELYLVNRTTKVMAAPAVRHRDRRRLSRRRREARPERAEASRDEARDHARRAVRGRRRLLTTPASTLVMRNTARRRPTRAAPRRTARRSRRSCSSGWGRAPRTAAVTRASTRLRRARRCGPRP